MNEKGQVLVISIVLMLVGLSAVVIISSRYVKSLHSFVKSDNSVKASYVAEALAERLLSKSTETLSDYVTNNSCLQECYVQFEDGSEAYAEVKILGNSSDMYTFKLPKDTTSEVNLDGYNSNSYVNICWDENSSIEGMYLSESSGNYDVTNYAYNAVVSPYDSDFDIASPNYSFANCFRVDTSANPVLLRLKSLYEVTTINVIPEPSALLPDQGFLVRSNGRFLDAYKRVTVTKKYPMSPDVFDYVLYQKSDDTALSK